MSESIKGPYETVSRDFAQGVEISVPYYATDRSIWLIAGGLIWLVAIHVMVMLLTNESIVSGKIFLWLYSNNLLLITQILYGLPVGVLAWIILGSTRIEMKQGLLTVRECGIKRKTLQNVTSISAEPGLLGSARLIAEGACGQQVVILRGKSKGMLWIAEKIQNRL